MLPFDVKKYTQKPKENNMKTACSQQAISNRIVIGSMPRENPQQPLQQQPAKQ